MKVILFNAPPSSGKDEAVNFLQNAYDDVWAFSFKKRLKQITLSVFDIPEHQWDCWYTTEGKELPRPELNGLSCRQALIEVSEKVIKPYYGNEYFGNSVVKTLQKLPDDFIACSSDSGFVEEAKPLVEAFGASNVYIVYIHRDGCSFKNDSRSWIEVPGVPVENYFNLINNYPLEHFYKGVGFIYNEVKSR